MDTRPSQLPWNDLNHTEGSIPWPALRTFAEVVVTDRQATKQLLDLYDEAHERALRETCYADLYVPAILALAAPGLADKQRREIGEFLVEKMVVAGRDDDDLGLEVLTAAVGAMGAVILPVVLDAIAREPDTKGAWVFLWSLTMLAVETDDPALRDPVVEACVNLLEHIDQGLADLMDGPQAAWTLASLKCTEHTVLLKRLAKKAASQWFLGDYEEALKLVQGRRSQSPLKELWERPVEEWLRAQWKTARDWYAQRQNQDDTADGKEEEEDARLKRVDKLTNQFMESSAAQTLPPDVSDDADFIVHSLLSRAVTHLDIQVEGLGESELCELLLEILPAKITAQRDVFEKIAPVTEAFLTWAGREGLVDRADALVAKVHNWSRAIVSNGMDPSYWGPAKTFAMSVEAAGIDITDREAVQKYIEQQNHRLLEEEDSDWDTGNDYAPPIPIVSHEPKIGRNDPCPCGSGRKYKKCCGNPAKPQNADI